MSFLSWDVGPAEVCSKWHSIATYPVYILLVKKQARLGVKSIHASLKKHIYCLKGLKGQVVQLKNLGVGF